MLLTSQLSSGRKTLLTDGNGCDASGSVFSESRYVPQVVSDERDFRSPESSVEDINQPRGMGESQRSRPCPNLVSSTR